MKTKIKKLFTLIFLFLFIFSNLNITIAKEGKEEKKEKVKEFNLGKKLNGKKLEKAKNTINQKDNYKLLIKSNKSLEEIKNEYSIEDPKIQVKEVGKNIFQIKLPKNSKLFG